MSPCVTVGGAECRPFGMALPSLLVQPGMRLEVDDVSADAACMLALLSDAAHEGGGVGGCLSQRAAWASPLFLKMVVVTVRPSLSLPPLPPPGFIKGHKQVGGDIILSPPPARRVGRTARLH